jgi:hypothetical protein
MKAVEKLLRVGATKAAELVAQGQIETVRIGKKEAWRCSVNRALRGAAAWPGGVSGGPQKWIRPDRRV